MDKERHIGASERFWEDRSRGREKRWSGRPNAVLVDIAGSLTPGSALDLACGEGRDAVGLADNGWRVTAADVSETATVTDDVIALGRLSR